MLFQYKYLANDLVLTKPSCPKCMQFHVPPPVLVIFSVCHTGPLTSPCTTNLLPAGKLASVGWVVTLRHLGAPAGHILDRKSDDWEVAALILWHSLISTLGIIRCRKFSQYAPICGSNTPAMRWMDNQVSRLWERVFNNLTLRKLCSFTITPDTVFYDNYTLIQCVPKPLPTV